MFKRYTLSVVTCDVSAHLCPDTGFVQFYPQLTAPANMGFPNFVDAQSPPLDRDTPCKCLRPLLFPPFLRSLPTLPGCQLLKHTAPVFNSHRFRLTTGANYTILRDPRRLAGYDDCLQPTYRVILQTFSDSFYDSLCIQPIVFHHSPFE